MDFAINTSVNDGLGQMTFDQATNYMNNVFLSLMVPQGSFFQNPNFGSRLYLLQRAKLTPQTAALVVDYVNEALQWLIDAGRITSVDVQTQEDPNNTGRLDVTVTATQANGEVITFNTFVGVV